MLCTFQLLLSIRVFVLLFISFLFVTFTTLKHNLYCCSIRSYNIFSSLYGKDTRWQKKKTRKIMKLLTLRMRLYKYTNSYKHKMLLILQLLLLNMRNPSKKKTKHVSFMYQMLRLFFFSPWLVDHLIVLIVQENTLYLYTCRISCTLLTIYVVIFFFHLPVIIIFTYFNVMIIIRI